MQQLSSENRATVVFLGSEVAASYDNAQVVIQPIPYEATTTYRKGCENGPAALLEASQQVELYDVELQREIAMEVPIYTADAIASTVGGQNTSSAMMYQGTQTRMAQYIADGKFAIALGGEHSITAPIVTAYTQALDEPFTVVQIDAHGDLRQEYEDSIYNHACVMRRILDLGLPILPVGIRSICAEEAQLITNQNIPVFWAHEIVKNPHWIEDAIAAIPTRKIFITIDLDGLDSSVIPGVGTPQPGGLDWYALTGFLRRLFQEYEVIGCDVMELAPIPYSVVSEFTAAKLTYKLIGYWALYR
ncbi:MAG: agmatinase [Jaaginema sp. PMC 1079.18]|nr:agmatinase [Jaaginema sp. PMC 1080.18]MEC4850722.1 agmatinase [Jaaginema sp. PMC 1079.18]MEC4867725.1 agmatinase [Jaaginema sp. PMC 1078.18]